MRATVEEVADFASLEHRWRDLERRSDASFFQSWDWVGCWLRELPNDVRPQAVVVRAGTEVVGLSIVVRHRRRRHGFVVSNGLYVGETGDQRYDAITVEYNGVLADRRAPDAIRRAWLSHLVNHFGECDEFYLSGVDPAYERTAGDTGPDVRVLKRSPCSYVSLDAIRHDGGDYLAGLSANTRYQVRRAIRRYEQRGPFTLEAADTVDRGLAYLDALKVLHQAYWNRRGKPGSFANPFFERFHRRLITENLKSGGVQLLKISVGGEPVGYLYNFVRNRWIYNYQSGFRYESDAKLKPGLVSHCLAIGYNLNTGAKAYDFMAGDSRYKRSLGNAGSELLWLVVRRNRLKYRVEDGLRAIRNRCRVIAHRHSAKE
ncbi:MAG: GNAT family N-acetyltransferase [Alphaproteobacteria bacterium]